MAKERIPGGTLEWNGRELIAYATEENEKAMKKATIYVQGIARKMIGGVGSGRLYKRKNKTHRASAPGKPPARDTGILANSVSYEVVEKGGIVNGFVGPDVDFIIAKQKGKKKNKKKSDPDYGFYLEMGTRNIARRPWLRPSLIKSQNKIFSFFKIANKLI